MKKVVLTCIECPLGCEVTVSVDEGNVIEVSGNTCPRGKAYAQSEIVCPARVVTTTVKTVDGRMLPVKSDKPIAKEKIFQAMEKINSVIVKTPIKIGDIILKDVFKDVNVVACANLK